MAGTGNQRCVNRIRTGAKIVDIKITHQCNNLCRFCVAGDKRGIFPDFPTSRIKALLAENVQDRGIVLFTGGEPTIRPDLPELVRYARETCGYKTVIIQTNGRRLAYKAYLEALAGNGADQFSVSIHGHTAALHEYLTQAPGSFTETVLGIRNLLERGLVTATNTVITKSNRFHLPEIAGLLGAMGVKQMQFAYPHLQGKALVNIASVAPWMSLAAPLVRRALEKAGGFGAAALTEGFPLCMLGQWESHAVENVHTYRKVIDSQGDIEDFHGHRMSRLKAHGPACAGCSRARLCEGPWAEYPERFSWKEFVPVS